MGSPRLSAKALSSILDSEALFVSPASFWEMEIKKAAGNLVAPDHLAEIAQGRGLRSIPITIAHAVSAGRLPPIHRDPFDRMLVAQAIAESLALVTADPILARYGCQIIRA